MPLSPNVADRLPGRLAAATIALGLLLAILVGGVVTPASSASTVVAFTDPSRTVACQIAEADDYTTYDRVRCDLLSGDEPLPLPPRPRGCQADWGTVVVMDQNDIQLPQWGACVGDSVAYGQAKPARSVVQAGSFRCTVLSEGVSCQNSSTGYGFDLAPKVLRFLRPASQAKLSAAGLGKMRLGMTTKRARRTGYLGHRVCGSLQINPRLHMGVWLTWREGRFDSVLANSYTRTQAKRRVGVGSMLTQVRAKYRGRVVATTDQVEGAPAYVYVVRGKRGRMVFLLQTPTGQMPSGVTPVQAVWVTRHWDPRKGYAFDGC